MGKVNFFFFFSILFSPTLYAGCACYLGATTFHHGVQQNHPYQSTSQLLMESGDSIQFYGYGAGTCAMNIFRVYAEQSLVFSSLTTGSHGFTITQPGRYRLSLLCEADLDWNITVTDNPNDTIQEHQIIESIASGKIFFGLIMTAPHVYTVRCDLSKVISVSVYNSVGQKIIDAGTIQHFDLINQSSGLYYYELKDAIGNSSRGKIFND